MLRRGAAVALAVVALALLMPAPTAAQADSPTISLSPDCAPEGERESVQVTGRGWWPGDLVDIYMDSTSGSRIGGATPDSSGNFSASVVTPARAGGYHRIVAANGYPNFQTADAGLRVPCTLQPRVGLTPTCAATGERELTVEGFDFPPRNDTRITFDAGGSSEFEITSATDENGYAIETFAIATNEEREYVVVVDDYGVYGATARAVYRVPCPPPTTTSSSSSTTTTTQPTTTTAATTTTTTTIPPPTPGATLSIVPPLGRPGFVAIARGEGFTPGPVTLEWEPGTGTTAAVAGDDGTFVTQVLIMPNDVLGLRTLIATGAVTTASAPFLVVPNSMKPAGRDVAQIVRAHRYLHR